MKQAASRIHTISVLEAAAHHERDLSDRIAAAEREAGQIIATVRQESAARAARHEARLSEEIALMRCEAEASQKAERRALMEEVERDTRALRKAVEAKQGDVARELAALVLPHAARGAMR